MSRRPAVTVGRVRRGLAARWDIVLVVAAGGAVGSLGRWGLASMLPHRPQAFPLATFATNVSGCLLLGALVVFVVDVWPPSRYLRPFLGVGVLGGFTTFSTSMLDTRTLLAAGRAATAAAYGFGSLAAGLSAVWLGATLARLATRARAGRTRRTSTSRTGTSRTRAGRTRASGTDTTTTGPTPRKTP